MAQEIQLIRTDNLDGVALFQLFIVFISTCNGSDTSPRKCNFACGSKEKYRFKRSGFLTFIPEAQERSRLVCQLMNTIGIIPENTEIFRRGF